MREENVWPAAEILRQEKGRQKMDLITGIKERRSIRKFADKMVPHEVLEEIVNVAAYAPSLKNTQISRYIVVEDREKIAALATEETCLGFPYNCKTMSKATAIVVQTMVNGRSGYEKDGSFTTPKGDRWEMYDAGIAAQTFCLAAHEKGIGTCIMGIFDDEKIAELLNLPEGQIVGAVISAGYPDEEPEAPARKGADVILTRYE